MKTRRFIAASLAAAAITTGVTAPAQAQTYPEPLNQVMNELRKYAGPQGPNLLLIPAATSSIGWILSALIIAGSFAAAGIAGSS